MDAKRIYHHKYGCGTVTGTRNQGFELHVAFDSGAKWWVRADTTQGVSEGQLLNFVVGDQVRHSTFGVGTVLKIVKDTDYVVTVHFPDVGTKVLVQSIARLTKADQQSGSSHPTVQDPAEISQSPGAPPTAGLPASRTSVDMVDHPQQHQPIPAMDNLQFKARRMIEAFRLGIVPFNSVQDFTFGREQETNQLRGWLADDWAVSLLVVGNYGSGKTHFLQHAYAIALQEGYAVATIEIDANESPFHKPKRIYTRLLETLRYRPNPTAQPLGFRSLLTEALDQGVLRDHLYFKHLIKVRDTYRERFWEWIEGREDISRPEGQIANSWWGSVSEFYALPALHPYENTANIYCYLLSGLSWAASNVLKLKGLVLLFDEAEALDIFGKTKQSEKGWDFLCGLLRCAQNDARLQGDPSEHKLTYCKMGSARSTPFSYKQPSAMKIVLATTPGSDLHRVWDHLLKQGSVFCQRMDLQSLTDESLQQALKSLTLFYRNAYGLEDSSDSADLFLKVHEYDTCTRMFIKAAVEALDLRCQ